MGINNHQSRDCVRRVSTSDEHFIIITAGVVVVGLVSLKGRWACPSLWISLSQPRDTSDLCEGRGCLPQRWKGQGGEEVSQGSEAPGDVWPVRNKDIDWIVSPRVCCQETKGCFLLGSWNALVSHPLPSDATHIDSYHGPFCPEVWAEFSKQTQLWGKAGGTGLRAESQTWASLLRWQTDLDFHFPRTPRGVWGRKAWVGSLGPLTVGPSPPHVGDIVTMGVLLLEAPHL